MPKITLSARDLAPNGRLGCRIVLAPASGGLAVHLPEGQY